MPHHRVPNVLPPKWTITYWTHGTGMAYDTWTVPDKFNSYLEAVAFMLVHRTSVEVLKIEVEREDLT